MRALAAALASFLLAGCATPVEKSLITPKFDPIAEKSVVLSVLEARPYVLSGDKLPKFEGLVRDGFGIPHTVYRPNRPEDERFVDLLADMIKDGFAAAGANVTVVASPLGTSAEDALRTMTTPGAGRYVVVEVLESNWTLNPFRGNVGYKHDFAVYVAAADLKAQSKRFSGSSEEPPSQTYTVFDMLSVRYRMVIESMFADPVIQQALR